MERPDIDATIHCVCSVFRAHIENSLQAAATAHVATPVAARLNLDIFRDDFEQHESRQQRRRDAAEVPTVAQIQAFYKEFYQRSQMEHDTIIMSLIYVERLMKLTHGALQPTPDNWSSVLISCMILASKVWGAVCCVRVCLAVRVVCVACGQIDHRLGSAASYGTAG